MRTSQARGSSVICSTRSSLSEQGYRRRLAAAPSATPCCLGGRRYSDQCDVYWFPPDVALPPAGIRFIVVGLALCNWESSCRFSWLAELSADGFFADRAAWLR